MSALNFYSVNGQKVDGETNHVIGVHASVTQSVVLFIFDVVAVIMSALDQSATSIGITAFDSVHEPHGSGQQA